jgi:hypothetical protein
MTIEFSLRRRATQARCFAVLWLSLAIVVLIGSYISLPLIASETLKSLNQIEGSMESTGPDGNALLTGKVLFIHLHAFALIILILCLSVVSFASYLLARTAFIELESAARFIGLADAICIAGDDFGQLEKAATLLVPRTKYFSELSEKNLKTFLEIVKNVRG